MSAANKAYYSLQGAGVCRDGVSPFTASHIYTTAVQSSLLYGNDCIYTTKSDMDILDKTQGKHLKSMLGLNLRIQSLRLTPERKLDYFLQKYNFVMTK